MPLKFAADIERLAIFLRFFAIFFAREAPKFFPSPRLSYRDRFHDQRCDMRQSPADWVKVNLNLPPRASSELKSLAADTESSSESEVLRQSLRYFEQLVEDEKDGDILNVRTGTGETIPISVDKFADNKSKVPVLARRSMLLHKKSEDRLNRLQHLTSFADASEVARSALRFYQFIVLYSKRNSKFFVKKRSGENIEVKFGNLSVNSDFNNKPTEEPGRPERMQQQRPARELAHR